MLALALVFLQGERRLGDVRVQGPGTRPQLGFACCDGNLEDAWTVLADPAVRRDLRALGAEVAVPPDAPAYDRLAGWFGRDPAWTPSAA